MDSVFSPTSWILLAAMLSGVFFSLIPVEKRKSVSTSQQQWN
jgi:putative membrane protein PagO